MKVCPKCKSTSVVEKDKYCYKDGESLVPQSMCRVCKRELLDGIDIYCPQCGVKVGAEVIEMSPAG